MKLPLDYSLSALKKNEMHLWLYSVSEMSPSVEALIMNLSSEEKDRASRFIREPDKIRYQTSHILLREILSIYTGVRPEEITYKTGPWGKPSLRNGSSIMFNMSHSGDYVLIGLSEGCEVGVDIERHKNLNDLNGMISQCCTPSETILFDTVNSEEKLELFYKLWTGKEAYVKGTGTGLSTPLKSIDLSSNNTVDQWLITEVNMVEDYTASVAFQSKECKLTFINHP